MLDIFIKILEMQMRIAHFCYPKKAGAILDYQSPAAVCQERWCGVCKTIA